MDRSMNVAFVGIVAYTLVMTVQMMDAISRIEWQAVFR